MFCQPLRLAAVSALALCASACAETPKAVSSSGVHPAATAANAQTAGQRPATLPVADLESEIVRAETLRAQGNLTESIRTFAQLVLIAPDDPRVIGGYGKALVQQGRSTDAVAFLKRSAQLKPRDWTLYSALGVAYDQMDDSKNAAAAYEHGLTLHPGDAAILNNYAVSRMLAGDLPAAQKLLKQAQTAGGYNPKLASNLALLGRMEAAKPASSPRAAHDATKAPQVLAAAPPPAHASGTAPKTQAVAPLAAGKQAVATPSPARSAAAMQPVSKQSPTMPANVSKGTPQGLALLPEKTRVGGTVTAPAEKPASASANTKLAVSSAPPRAATGIQTGVKDGAVRVNAPGKPAQSLASAPRDIRPAAASPQPARVVMQAVPKDPQAGPVKVADKPVQPAAHAAPNAPRLRLAKSTPAKPVAAKSAAPALRTADQSE